jgi:hypothetical protein
MAIANVFDGRRGTLKYIVGSLAILVIGLFIGYQFAYVPMVKSYEADIDAYETDIAAYETNNAIVQANMDELNANYNSALFELREYRQIEDKSNLIQQMDDQIRNRKPLLPQLNSNEVIQCTGSMDPAITCFDQVTLLTNPLESEIVVGAVIVFSPTIDCDFSPPYMPGHAFGDRSGIPSMRVMHRVTERKAATNPMSFGYFRTKGDNNDTDDGCWIPFGRVESYVVAVKKSDNPEALALLEQLWAIAPQQALYYNLQERIQRLRDSIY